MLERVERCTPVENIYFKYVLCYLTDPDVHLLQIQAYCCDANHTAHGQELFPFCVLLNIHCTEKCFN
jgi:hypothetical protein